MTTLFLFIPTDTTCCLLNSLCSVHRVFLKDADKLWQVVAEAPKQQKLYICISNEFILLGFHRVSVLHKNAQLYTYERYFYKTQHTGVPKHCLYGVIILKRYNLSF